MLETKLLISKAKEEARSLDQLLIDGRKPVISLAGPELKRMDRAA